MGLSIKREDTVVVLSGRDKGKRGRVLSVMPTKNMLVVERINMVKRHMKPSKQYQQGGIIEKESPISLSKAMLVCPKCDKPARIANKALADGRKLRACKKCGEVIDQ
jgi:large subunit ribosomal protein L24